ncbi:MAG: hypothetical protein GSR85_00275 [Desulfurococcales archaeon]|nr:hypothetical protein [Desulfurococcales archaeon]
MQGDDRVKAEIETRIREIEEAIRIIREGKAKRIYLNFGRDVMIEVDKDYALEHLERRLLALRAALS